jgi:hypothetical protein
MEDRIRSGDLLLPVWMCRQYILGMPDLGQEQSSGKILARWSLDGLQRVIWGLPPKLHGRPCATWILKLGFPPVEDEDEDEDEDSLTGTYTWKIENFTKAGRQKLYSEPFAVGGYKW